MLEASIPDPSSLANRDRIQRDTPGMHGLVS